MEIAPGVHAVRLLGAMGHLIMDDELTLIDAGLPGSRLLLGRYLAGHGRSLSGLGRIVITHGHPDHAGGARDLERDGVEVLMHPADINGLGVTLRSLVARPTRGRFFSYITPTPTRATPLVDGQLLPVLGGLEVVHTPGHTPGSICLFSAKSGLLFVGDALEMRRGQVSFASPRYSSDPALARASVQRIAELDVDTIVFSHYPPWRTDARGILQRLAMRAAGP